MAETLLEMASAWSFGVFFLLLGLCVGSFLNVCIYRLPAGMSLAWPMSHCPACLSPIAWYDNVPVLSYFVLRGRCRKCRSRFSARYAVVEAATGLIFFGFWLAYYRGGLRAGADHLGVYVVHMVLASALVASSVIDFDRKEIYTSVTNFALGAGLVGSFVWPQVQRVGAYDGRLPDWTGWPRGDAVLLAAVGAVVGAALILVIRTVGTWAFKREAMGIGDAYLLAAVGGVLGWEAAVLVFLLAPFLGLVYGLWQLARHREHEVPYGPFLSGAALIIMVVENPVVNHFRPGIEAMWHWVFK